ncbi:hypothetical protein [Vibrio mediterranei]|uniref:hypothetical protein n=1 Tax=Vibrio mediterranei TaxID=689 RepID=UPI0022837D1B|nr:hypothetical protein [Vibrio mediterranei]MCY9854353.1 hypothetical protein [Vibrio mediterranei]
MSSDVGIDEHIILGDYCTCTKRMNSEPTEVLNECDGNAIAVLSKNTLVYYAVPIGLFEKMLAAYDASLFNLVGS